MEKIAQGGAGWGGEREIQGSDLSAKRVAGLL